MLLQQSKGFHKTEDDNDLGTLFQAQASTLGLLTAEAEALAPPPVQAAALRQMGLELAQRGRAADAAPLLRRALALAPEDEAAAAALAMLRARFGSVGDLT